MTVDQPRTRVYFRRVSTILLAAAMACFGIVLLFIVSPSAAAVQTTPHTLHYQGRLTDASGSPMADGQYNMTFRLFSVTSGGSAVWTEVRDTTSRVAVTNGQFAVQLGEVSPLAESLFVTQSLYLEVELPTPATATCSTVGCASYSEGPMTPRQSLASSAYALNSDTLDGIDSTSFARKDANNTFTGTQLFKTSDSATAFAVQNAAGSNVLVVDTANQHIGIGSISSASTPSGTLEVRSASTDSAPTLVINNQGSGDIARFQAAGVSLFTVSGSGSVVSTNATNSTAAFTIQRATGGGILLRADTTNNRLAIGDATGTDIDTTLLVLDSAASDPIVNATNGSMYYNTATQKFRCRQGGVFVDCIGSGGGVTTKQVTLVPEFAGSVLTGDGSNNNVNVTSDALSGLAAASGYKHNFYAFDTTATTAQDYGIIINYQLPSDFTSFVAGSFNIWTFASSLTSTDVTFTLKSNSGVACYVSAVSVKPATAATWEKKLPGDPGNGCSFAANDVITIIITPTVIQPSTNKVDIGEVHFAYQ